LITVVVVICLTHGPRANPSNAKLSNKKAEFLQPVHQPLLSTADIEPVQTFADELILAELPPPAQVMLPEIEEPMAKPETPTKTRALLLIKRRDKSLAEDLAKQLLTTPVISLDKDNNQAISGRVVAAARRTKDDFPHPAPQPLLEREDLTGLPIRMGVDCHLGKEATESLNVLSQKLRNHLANARRQDLPDTRINADFLRTALQEDHKVRKGEWEQLEAIPTLVQMLMPEDRPVRMLLVELLAKSSCRQATLALAQRALFDLSPEVREAAIAALKERPAEDYRAQLLAGFRYPWPPVADHAAEALVALDDQGSVPALVPLLDNPDPAAPIAQKGKTQGKFVVNEMVRISHLANCLMCHAPSFSSDDLVRGHVPVLGQSIDATRGGYGGGSTGAFVRADITYLKQDFSVQQPVAKHAAWPANQRFDYMVRTRPATFDEILEGVKKSEDYPQREAVLFALRELTGDNQGNESMKWWQSLMKQGVSKK
jgi:HEAT repeat protein